MNKVSFTKITSTPTTHAWSQTYSAGNFAALISLHQSTAKSKNSEEKIELQTIGHDIVSTLESEYFTLEKKDLASIKQAVTLASEKIPEDVKVNLIVVTVVDTILYGFLYGGGKILIKRVDKVGLLLEKPTLAITDATAKLTVTSTSGYLENHDMVILASDALLDTFPEEKLFTHLSENSAEETAETLMPQLQKKKDGAACAIILTYTGEVIPSEEQPLSSSTPIVIPDSTATTEISVTDNESTSHPFSLPAVPKMKVGLILLACILGIIIIGSIFMTIHKKQQDQEHTKFQTAYTTAQSKYDEGQNLLALNKQEAHDDFTTTVSLLKPFEGKLSGNPSDNTQFTDLLTKANTALSQITNGIPTSAKQADDKASPLLSAEMKQNALYAAQDTKNMYLADANGITAIDTANQKANTIVKNTSDWSDLGGLGTYLGNLYVLDKKSTILKYVPAGSGYAKSDYLKDKVSLSSATSLAIDGDVYVLFMDGSIKKFTKGTTDAFSVTGLEKPLKNPTRIFTTVDDTNLYILDNGNGRVVVVNKTGAYQNQYSADVLSSAKDLDVNEKDKKIFILSQNKIWEIDMK